MQTAVEWLFQKLPTIDKYDPYYSDIIKQAKEMEKQQLEDAWYAGDEDGAIHEFEYYYNETYRSKGSDKEEQKKLITEIMNEDAKDGLYNTSSQTANDIVKKKTGKMTEEEWQAAERAQTSSQTEISAVKYLSDAILSQKYNNDIFDLHNIIQNAFLIENELLNKQMPKEISDKEIEKAGWDYELNQIGDGYEHHFIEGAKWYREQLKKKI